MSLMNILKRPDRSAQSGRSLVELLGVLAVIGALSVSGLYAYNFLMARHRNNQLLNEANARAVAVSTKMLAGTRVVGISGFSGSYLGHEISLHKIVGASGDAFQAVSATDSLDATETQFAIEIAGVPSNVCSFFESLVSEKNAIQKIVVQKEDGGSYYTTCEEAFAAVGTDGNVNLTVNIYLVYNSDMSDSKASTGEGTGSDSYSDSGFSGSLHETTYKCSEHGKENWLDGLAGCECEKGYSEVGCSTKEDEKAISCSGNGHLFVFNNSEQYKPKCVCDSGWAGDDCQEILGFSPCQTLEIKGDKEIRGFKESGTKCETAGVEGKCNDRGRCVPFGGVKCSKLDDCSEGYFCNYGGHVGDYQKGGTPDICQKTTANTFEYQGKLYLYNTDADLRSWCRPADKEKNCTWGFLSYYGAQSWCKSLGADLVDASFIKSNCAEFKKHLPQVGSDQVYWVSGQSVAHLGNNCEIQKMGRTDGYAWAGAVVCSKLLNGFTADEQAFYEDMKAVNDILKDVDFSQYSFALNSSAFKVKSLLQELKGVAEKVAQLKLTDSNATEYVTELEWLHKYKESYDSKNYKNQLDNLISE